MDSMVAVDKAATELGLFTSTNGDRWKDLSLAKVETEVRRWAKDGNVMAQKLVGLLDALKGEVSALDILWKTYTRVVRPANGVRGYNSLKDLLESFEKIHLVNSRDCSEMRFIPDKAIVVRMGDRKWVAYLPARVNNLVVPEAEKGWDWVKKAEARAVELIMDGMQKSDTGLNMGEVKTSGKEGTIFLRAGAHKGALLEDSGPRRILRPNSRSLRHRH